jgi:hypothetical protein
LFFKLPQIPKQIKNNLSSFWNYIFPLQTTTPQNPTFHSLLKNQLLTPLPASSIWYRASSIETCPPVADLSASGGIRHQASNPFLSLWF